MAYDPLLPIGRVPLGYTPFAHAPVPHGFAVSPWPCSAGGWIAHALHDSFQDQGAAMRRGFQDTHASGNIAERLGLDLRVGGDNAGKVAVVSWTPAGRLDLYHARWPRYHSKGEVWLVLLAHGEALVVSGEGRLVPARLHALPETGASAWRGLFAWIAAQPTTSDGAAHRTVFRFARAFSPGTPLHQRLRATREGQSAHHSRPWPAPWWRRWGALGTLAALEPVVRSLAALPRPTADRRTPDAPGLAPWLATFSDPLSRGPKIGHLSEDARPLLDALALVLPYAEHLYRQHTGQGFDPQGDVVIHTGDLMPDGTTDLPFPSFPVDTFVQKQQEAATHLFRHLVAPHARRSWAGQQTVVHPTKAPPHDDALARSFALRERLLTIPLQGLAYSAHQRLAAIPQAERMLADLRLRGTRHTRFSNVDEGILTRW